MTRCCELTWTEKGGPPTRDAGATEASDPRLINQLAAQLHGEVRLKYEPAGLVYELDVPVNALRDPKS